MEWLIIILIRLLIPLTILRWNLFGSILAIVADNLDVVILDYLGIKDFSPYNRVDKFLDTYLYLIQGYTILFWQNKLAKKIGIFLLGYRLIGFILYEVTNLRILLFIFPNLFIFFYMFYLLYKKILKKDPFKTLKKTLLILTVLLVLKLGHEYVLHVSQFPIYSWIKTHILTFIFS